MATPIGEDSWLAYLEETVRNASDLEKCVHAIEVHKRAIAAEPGSLRLWLAYCNYFWSLWESNLSPRADWSEEEQSMGREVFSFGAALDLWQQGYESIKYRLDDSHLLWNRWVGLEMELLSKTRTANGIKRITHLYRDRLLTPHMTWDETSQSYSSFLSEYNKPGWEEAMKEITTSAQDVKRLIAARDPFEIKLKQAARDAKPDAHKAIFLEYLEWEMRQSKRNNDSPEIGMDLCRGLYARALTGPFARDENVWHEYITHLSASVAEPQAPVDLLEVLRRAVEHCPWSGELWSRNILCAEEAKLAFAEIESIKHAATSQDLLYKNGMESMIEMYVAWCGFLKRKAMDASAGEEAVDVADVGLAAALEDVAVVGKRLYGKDFQGDPKFRLERIYIQYLTEKKGAIDEARAQWNKLASMQIHADNHDFWLLYYMWEMLIFSSRPSSLRSPTPSSNATGFRVPALATSVLTRAVTRTNIDWPEKILEVYLQHCNDYEPPTSLRNATDRVQKATKALKKRREQEQQEKEDAYAAYYNEQQAGATDESAATQDAKRKREELQSGADEEADGARKRRKNDSQPSDAQAAPRETSGAEDQAQKRDREHTTILVDNLPHDITQTKLRQYFREYGQVKNVTALVRNDATNSSTALVEFSSPDEAVSALLRDGKYMGQSQLSVTSGHDLTVYIANYPPTADDLYIRNLFKDCGDILSIRWPSLKLNTHRRFCYISFRSREASAQAVKEDGKLLEGKYNLLAKYSDPNQKKKREGALAEGRELHLSNLDRGIKESDLKDVFSKYGTVTRINIPQTLSGTNRGFAFLDFETAEQAQEAVAHLNNTKFRSQVLQVELSKDFKVKSSAKSTQADHRSPSVASGIDAEGDATMGDEDDVAKAKVSQSDIRDRTVGLMGLPDTVNDARVRALVEPLGTVVSLVLQPRHGSAKIEFADANTAGKASLGLDGMEFEGSTLRTGSLEELHHAKPVNEQSGKPNEKPKAGPTKGLMAPPVAIRRPGAQKAGPKRGLGFVGSRKEAGDASAESSTGKSNGAPKPKSNADFRALYMADKKQNGGESDKPLEGEKGN
jgi:squamous cell carcinoma antigen recognized by T-cells 3